MSQGESCSIDLSEPFVGVFTVPLASIGVILAILIPPHECDHPCFYRRRRRLRPILMITCITALALGFGEGSKMNAPMARVVIGGILVSALFTTFFVPTLYGALFRGQSKKRHLQARFPGCYK